MKNIRIGEVLKNYGYVTDDDIGKALDYQKKSSGKRLGEVMIELGFVTENQMLEALSKRLELEVIDLGDAEFNPDAVDMIPKNVAQKYNLIAVKLEGSNLMVAMSDPLNFYAVEDVRQITQMQLMLVLAGKEQINNAIDFQYAQLGTKQAINKANLTAREVEVEELENIEDTGDEAPIVQALNSVLVHGYSIGASDIHIEPFEDHVMVRMRVDGVVTEIATLSASLHLSLMARIKIVSDMDIAERRLPQDGHFRSMVDGIDMNARVSIIPTVYGEKAVIRFLFTDVKVDDAEQFGMTENNFKKYKKMMDSPHGMVYITGPTGSGKTTTLYMMLEQMSQRAVNISTIEDPVERNLPKINQVQVNNVSGLTFERGLRSLLRQDPDIIMVGETRDSETASIAVRAAITGHLVFSTLHTNDAVSSIVRLRDMGVPSYLVANSMVGMVAQRLVRKICPFCEEEYEISEAEQRILGAQVRTLKRGKGCPKCNNTGYKGRRAIHEVVYVDQQLRKMITADTDVEEIYKYIEEHQDFKTLFDEARDMVVQGITTLEEFNKVAYYAQ